MEAKQLSLILQTPQPMIDAMLDRLEAMDKAVRIKENKNNCIVGSCNICHKGKSCIKIKDKEWWILR